MTGLLLASVAGGVYALRDGDAEAATGPCETTNAWVAPNEQELFTLVNGWRASNLGMPAMQLSGPANRAAQWFAEAMIAGTTSGHNDEYGRSWAQRLADCGFGPNYGSGEALAGFGSSDPGFGDTPAEALASMTSNPSHQNAVNAPVVWECVGVGFASNPNPGFGDWRYAWVVVAVNMYSPCPEPGGGTPPESPTATNTPTATPTKTPTKTPSPTPTPTPPGAKRAVAPGIARWPGD